MERYSNKPAVNVKSTIELKSNAEIEAKWKNTMRDMNHEDDMHSGLLFALRKEADCYEDATFNQCDNQELVLQIDIRN